MTALRWSDVDARATLAKGPSGSPRDRLNRDQPTSSTDKRADRRGAGEVEGLTAGYVEHDQGATRRTRRSPAARRPTGVHDRDDPGRGRHDRRGHHLAVGAARRARRPRGRRRGAGRPRRGRRDVRAPRRGRERRAATPAPDPRAAGGQRLTGTDRPREHAPDGGLARGQRPRVAAGGPMHRPQVGGRSWTPASSGRARDDDRRPSLRDGGATTAEARRRPRPRAARREQSAVPQRLPAELTVSGATEAPALTAGRRAGAGRRGPTGRSRSGAPRWAGRRRRRRAGRAAGRPRGRTPRAPRRG